jgi:chromosome segregation ATPase
MVLTPIENLSSAESPAKDVIHSVKKHSQRGCAEQLDNTEAEAEQVEDTGLDDHCHEERAQDDDGLRRMTSIRKAMALVKMHVEDIESERQNSSMDAEEARLEAIEAKEVINTQSDKLADLQREHDTQLDEFREALQTIESLNEEVSSGIEQQKSLETCLSDLSEDLKEEREIRHEKETKIEKTFAQIISLSDAFKAKEEKIILMEQEIDRLKGVEEELKVASHKNDYLEDLLKGSHEKCGKLESDLKVEEERCEELEADLKAVEQKYDENEAKNADIKEENDLLRRKLVKYKKLYEGEANNGNSAASAYRLLIAARQKQRK